MTAIFRRVVGWAPRQRRLVVVIAMVSGALLSAGVASASASGVSRPAGADQPSGQLATPQTRAQWRQEIRHLSVPAKGCYQASFPTLQWHAVTCAAAPTRPLKPEPPSAVHSSAVSSSAAPSPFAVGDGHDYSAQVTGLISSATGSFDDVSPDITEKGQVGGSGPLEANTFTLQLNTQFFSTPTCSGSSDPAQCQGWEQFVYETDANMVFMQYWLLDYDTTCPLGWWSYGGDCYTNSPASLFPGSPLTAAELASAQLEGEAAQGGEDAVVLTEGGSAAAASNPDSVMDLAAVWNTTEFGVYGDGGGSEAYFGNATTLEAQTSLEDSDNSEAPTCVMEGFTGETNNLNLSTTPGITAQGSPTMLSRQTNGTTSNPTCAVITSNPPEVASYDVYYEWTGQSGYSKTSWDLYSSGYSSGDFSDGHGYTGTWVVAEQDFLLQYDKACDPILRGELNSSGGLNSEQHPGTIRCSADKSRTGTWYATLVSGSI